MELPTPGEPSRVSCTIDLEAPGKHQGFLSVPWSRDDSAWGALRIPITLIRGGDGPTMLLTAGSHGDEYEGPIALMKLAEALDPGSIDGTLILLPTMNHPAVQAARRTSPIDGGNMNRLFPGERRGGVSSMIAHFVYHHLVARADIVLDLHSGGKSLDFVPSLIMHDLEDADIMARTRAAGLAFGAPVTLNLKEFDMEGMLDLAVESLGKIFLSTELGGGGGTAPERIRIAERGVINLLKHFELMTGPIERPERPTRPMRTPGEGFMVADVAGMVEPLVEVGAEVHRDQAIAQIHFYEDHAHDPLVCHAPIAGLLYSRHYPGLIKPGDCLAVIAVDEDAS